MISLDLVLQVIMAILTALLSRQCADVKRRADHIAKILSIPVDLVIDQAKKGDIKLHEQNTQSTDSPTSSCEAEKQSL